MCLCLAGAHWAVRSAPVITTLPHHEASVLVHVTAKDVTRHALSTDRHGTATTVCFGPLPADLLCPQISLLGAQSGHLDQLLKLSDLFGRRHLRAQYRCQLPSCRQCVCGRAGKSAPWAVRSSMLCGDHYLSALISCSSLAPMPDQPPSMGYVPSRSVLQVENLSVYPLAAHLTSTRAWRMHAC
jgi:hypothetical protein